MNATDAWLAGLFDGEGCLMLRVHKHRKGKGISIIPEMSLSMSSGEWVLRVTSRLKRLKINHSSRKRKGQTEIRVSSWRGTNILCKALLPHSTVKKPLLVKFVNPIIRTKRSKSSPLDQKTIVELANLVDFVHIFNKHKNHRYKWTGSKIKRIYGIS